MDDVIRTVRGTPKRLSLNPSQRVLIDTPAGLIQIAGTHRVNLELIVPKCYRFRKGPRAETELHMRYLEVSERGVVAAYRFLVPCLDGQGEIDLVEPDVIPVSVG